MFDSSPTTTLVFYPVETICLVTMVTPISLVPVRLVTLVSLVSLVSLVTMVSLVILVSLVTPVRVVTLVDLNLHNFQFYPAHLWKDFRSCFRLELPPPTLPHNFTFVKKTHPIW